MNANDETRTLITARYGIPVVGQILDKPYIEVQNGKVVGVKRFRDVDTRGNVEIFDLGDAVILPGLINAHSQLDLCHLQGRVPFTGSFTAWLQTLFASHRVPSRHEVASGIQKGLREAISGGTTAIGDVSMQDWSIEAIGAAGLRSVVYLEVINIDPELAHTEFERIEQRIEDATAHEVLTARTDSRPLMALGLAPFAPYAVSSELYRLTLQLMIERGDRLCTRIAESEEERKLLQVYEGEFVQFLEGMFPEGPPPMEAAASPVHYLVELLQTARPKEEDRGRTQAFRVVRPPVLVHCHYLDVEDIQMIGRMRAPVVYCPRHHDFFEHPKAPIEDLLNRAMTVGLGTASLASNETLSMLDEMRYLARHPEYEISDEEVLRMATLYGARALAIEDEVGVIAPGMQADLTAVAIPHNTPEERLVHTLMHDDSPAVFTMVAGNPIYERPE